MEIGDGSGRPLAAMLAASLALHVAVVLATRVVGAHVAHAAPALADPADTWAGTTSLPGELVDVGVETPARAVAPAPASPPAPAPEPETTAAAPPPAKAPSPATAHAADAAVAAHGAAPMATSAAPSEAQKRPSVARHTPPRHRDRHDEPKPRAAGVGAAKRPSTPGIASNAAPVAAPATPAATSGEGGSFGAEGRAAVRDIGRAFTRALPAACVADRGWADLPPGDAGRLTIRVTLDDAGKITGWEPDGTASPPPRLVATVKRTLAMLEAGTFALAKGSAGAGVAVLELRARVEDRTPDDDGSGGAMRLEQRWSGDHGTAAFTQPSGRHVEVTIRRVP